MNRSRPVHASAHPCAFTHVHLSARSMAVLLEEPAAEARRRPSRRDGSVAAEALRDRLQGRVLTRRKNYLGT
jgi:hypothetical protein